MKKILVMVLLGILLVGCSNDQGISEGTTTKDDDTTAQDDTKQNTEKDTTETESKYPFPEDAQSVGDSNIIIRTPAGTSEDGNVPVLFVESDTMLTQIGLDLENFQGDKETFIYVNKMFVSSEQVGEMSQTSLELEGDLLKPGTYTVSAIQFEGNDPNGKVVVFTQAKYEVKEGS